ncbi:MAG: CHAT domain-containing protein [Pseudonocardiaceae bacterium]
MTSQSDAFKAAAERVLARDDLLQVAYDAEDAVGIVRQNDRLGHAMFTEPELFDLALRRHLQGADESESWAIRGQHLAYAGAIVRFCELTDIRISPEHDSVALYRQALEELSAIRQRQRSLTLNHEDLTLGVLTTYHAVRNLRLAGKPLDALRLAWQPDEYFYGTGAEPHRGHFEFEVSACKLALSESSQAMAALNESEGHWASSRAAVWPTRNRYEFARALAAFAEGDASETERYLKAALAYLPETRSRETQHDIQILSLTLAFIEFLTMREMSEATTGRALDLITQAVSLVELIRGRWRVVARSRSPLSLVFQRIYGDIALLVSRMSGNPEAARLGLRVALSAKQTGFASLMRANRFLMNNHLSVLVDEIVVCEDQLEYTNFTNDDEQQRIYLNLERLRAELEDAVTPLLADFVLPEPTDVEPVVESVGARCVVDFVALPETTTHETNWFRTLIWPDGSIEFGLLPLGPAFQAFFHGHDGRSALVSKLAARTLELEQIWHGLAQELLPISLLDQLATTPSNEPIDLLISPHSDLCFVPWPALEIDGSSTRLIERAVITQTPALTCLSHATIPPVRGPALVRLVAPPHGVNVEHEREAWGLSIDHYEDSHGQVPLSRCDLGPHRNVIEVLGNLASALDDKNSKYGFVHVAAHGSGIGLAQEIELPERLTAGHALGIRWPTSVLLAACHVGKVDNLREAEPFGFPTALLAGGAQCVVAGIQSISDKGTGVIAAAIVDSVHQGARLSVALRDAQCKLLREGWDVYDWGLLSAFVR